MANAFLEQKLMPIAYGPAAQMHMLGIYNARQQELMRQPAAAQANMQREAWARQDRLAEEERDRQARRMSSPGISSREYNQMWGNDFISGSDPAGAIHRFAMISGVPASQLSAQAGQAWDRQIRMMQGGAPGSAQPEQPANLPGKSEDVQRQLRDASPGGAGALAQQRELEQIAAKGKAEAEVRKTPTSVTQTYKHEVAEGPPKTLSEAQKARIEVEVDDELKREQQYTWGTPEYKEERERRVRNKRLAILDPEGAKTIEVGRKEYAIADSKRQAVAEWLSKDPTGLRMPQLMARLAQMKPEWSHQQAMEYIGTKTVEELERVLNAPIR